MGTIQVRRRQSPVSDLEIRVTILAFRYLNAESMFNKRSGSGPLVREFHKYSTTTVLTLASRGSVRLLRLGNGPHRALLIPDVLHQVFRYFDLTHWQHAEFKKDPSRTENARLRSLAASARVCTLFRDVALPVLWETLSDPAPLLRLLSCTMTGTAAPNSRVFNLDTSSVPLQEMLRLMFYGSLVRRIEPRVGTHMCDPGSSIHTQVVDPASWAYLHALVGSRPGALLPNLRTCFVEFRDPPELALLPILASSTLSSVTLINRGFYGVNPRSRDGWQSIVDQQLLEFFFEATNVTSFKLQCQGLHLSPLLVASLIQASSLRSLDLCFLSPSVPLFTADAFVEAFRLFSPLECLERFALYHHLASEVSALPSDDPQASSMLPHLRELDISPAWRARNLCAIFQLLQSTELRRIMINTLDYMDVSSVREVCETTVACFPSLTSFKCHLSHPGEPGADPLPIVPIRKAIAPLLAASSLVTVTISTSGMKLRNPQLRLTDEDFDAIAAFWPRLQDLCLIGLTPEAIPGDPTPAGVSIYSLIALATHCPDLQQLELPSLDLRAHRLGPVHTYPFLHHTLRSFHCQDLLCDDYPFAARVLDRLFPRLDVIPQLVYLSRLARGTRTTAQTLSAFGGTLVSDYRLFLAITVCQDGRARRWALCSSVQLHTRRTAMTEAVHAAYSVRCAISIIPHPALLVPDIVHHVFRYFDLDHWQHATFERDRSRTENARLRALAASARVCEVFRDAALPVLWGSLCNITPLVRLLSSCIKEPLKTAANAKGSTGPYVFRIEATEIPSHEKERLTYYGSLVRRVDTNGVAFRYCERGSNVYSHSIDPSSWTYLQVLVGDLPAVLLPNLQYYTVDFGHPSELALLRLGASPSLLRVDLRHRGVAGIDPDLREEWQTTIDQLLSDVIPVR
ncbi:hypothetical protein NUW54_g4944 [Trametes sanguinea]|uniref:Uncharacterized protein n=1 Tax=Trametes sanguinea TaxID=158606 RepID=A0ACC1PXR5_9APHY|nr:hypothetical protein NUW54_g4944 [Trametes sanguinea]